MTLTGLTMEMYMSREGWYHINRGKHEDLNVKRVLGSH